MSLLHRLFRRDDEDAARVPAMDGVFKPNAMLDTAERIVALRGIDNLAVTDGVLLASSGDTLHRVDLAARTTEPLRRFAGAVTMVAASPSGRVAAGVEGHGVELGSVGGDWRALDLPAEDRGCVTAGVFRGEDELVLAVGSTEHRWSDWKRDLMGHGASGRVRACRLSDGSVETLAAGLAFPYGIAVAGDRLVIAESWRHRLIALSGAAVLLADLPAYPARLAPAADGGFWLALFAPRRQLTEFVLREDDYRREMMATIPPAAWIGPDFGDGAGLTEPLQSGSVRQMGIMKPWAPSRSYGLVVRLDRNMAPVATFHSRADGAVHGIASVAELDGRLYAASRGAGLLVALDAPAGRAA
jgi:hypothetical protein